MAEFSKFRTRRTWTFVFLVCIVVPFVPFVRMSVCISFGADKKKMKIVLNDMNNRCRTTDVEQGFDFDAS